MAFLNDAVQRALAAVEQKFLFRKIGLPFDYASNPDDFPSKAFANAKEARNNLPNPTGLGGGYHYSCRNHALLFDSYLLRLEMGIEAPGDEAILDRLIGGLIRLATIAPKSFLVGGLAPDGRGFHAQPRLDNHVAWAFAVFRGLATSAISPESQEKFRSIAGKWIERVKREKFRLHTVDGKPVPDGDFSRPEPGTGPHLLAMLLTAARASGEGKDHELYAAMAEEEGRARLQPLRDCDIQEDMQSMLWRQAALALLAGNDPEPSRAALARGRLRDNAQTASRRIVTWREWTPPPAESALDLDWRKRPRVSPDESPLGFLPHESWALLEAERNLETALDAMYIMLLAADAEFVEPHAAEMEECLAGVPWEGLSGLNAVAPVAGVHARGLELGLWDKALYDSHRVTPSSETSFSAKYLEPDYDADNPDKAGHRSEPPGKRKDEPPGKSDGKKKRRRRRK